MSFRNTFQEDTDVLRNGAARGLVNLRICWQAPNMKLARAISGSTVPRAHIQNLDQNTQALRTQYNTLGRTGALAAGQDHICELARIYVPAGNIAHVEFIEQYLADVNGMFYASSSGFWGMPYNETVNMNGINWHFRLDYYNGQIAPAFNYAGIAIPDYRSLLPGYGWPDLPELNGLWFPAGLRKQFRGTVPAQKQLRMFVYVPAAALTVYSWNVAGRLEARLQSELCIEARANTRLLN